jgi:hypothetical protein
MSSGSKWPPTHQPVYAHDMPLTRKWLQSNRLESATQSLTAAGACILTDCCGAKIKSELSIGERVGRVLGLVVYQPRRSQPPISPEWQSSLRSGYFIRYAVGVTWTYNHQRGVRIAYPLLILPVRRTIV